jgi:hypothetical protein
MVIQDANQQLKHKHLDKKGLLISLQIIKEIKYFNQLKYFNKNKVKL